MNKKPNAAPVACENTDRELWRSREGDFYAASIHVTADGAIGINVGGTCFVRHVEAWHELAAKAMAPAPNLPDSETRDADAIMALAVPLIGQGYGGPRTADTLADLRAAVERVFADNERLADLAVHHAQRAERIEDNCAEWKHLASALQDRLVRAEQEAAALKADIGRYVESSSALATEVEELRELLGEAWPYVEDSHEHQDGELLTERECFACGLIRRIDAALA